MQKWLLDRHLPADDCFERADLMARIKIHMPDQQEYDFSEQEDNESTDDQDNSKSSSSREDQDLKNAKLVFMASCAKSKNKIVTPTLDSYVTYFGNRVEPFAGSFKLSLEYLAEVGEKSRVYGVFSGAGKCDSLFEWDAKNRSWLQKRVKNRRGSGSK